MCRMAKHAGSSHKFPMLIDKPFTRSLLIDPMVPKPLSRHGI